MSTHTHESVLVVGGGIGGLSAALALCRAGHRVRLLEQADDFVEVGAGLQLAPNATRALAALGVLDRLDQHAVYPERLVMMDAVDGREITALNLGAAFRARYGAAYMVLHRHDLLCELLAACRDTGGIELETGRRVSSVDADACMACITCEDGSSYSCDALVGADGLRSTLRPLVTDDEPMCSGYVAYRGPVPIERVGDQRALDSVVLWIGPGKHLVQYPLRQGRIYNQVAVFRSDRYTPDGDDWGTPDELVEHFSAMCEPVAASISLLDKSMRWPMYDRAPVYNWTRGAVTLLGDAAHPMLQYLAQGACQAIEDAIQIAKHYIPGSDPHEAFVRYQTLRIPRTARVQHAARLWGDLWHLDGVGRTVRNRQLRLRDPQDYSDTDWLYGAVSAERTSKAVAD